MSEPVLDSGAVEAVAAMLRDAGRRDIMPRFRRLDPAAVRTKSGPHDLVTDADEAAERRLTAALRERFPGCLVVGEEACATDDALLPKLRDAALAFVVDPVDGTANFASGVPLFGAMIAAIRHGEVVAGWIHDPVGDDTAVALRGGGAWMEDAAGGRTRLRVAEAVPPVAMRASVSFRYMPEPLRSRVAGHLPRLGAHFDYHCAAHAYRVVAAGHAHLLVFNRLMPWDHAAGWLLHREAGGYSARLDGSDYTPLETAGGLIVVPDEASWHAVREALLEP